METIKQLILSGLLKDLLIGERSFTLNREINKRYNSIEAGVKVKISDILYDLSYTEMALSLSRLYDNPHNKYPTRCLKRIYKIFKEADYQVAISHKEDALLHLSNFDFHLGFIELLKESSTRDFNRRSVAYFESLEANEPLRTSIDKLRGIRDKLLAHNEDVTIDSTIPYENIEHLLVHAKNVISFFSLTYCGIHLKVSDRFYLSDKSRKWRLTFDQFIKRENSS